MVQVVENRSAVSGVVKEVERAGDRVAIMLRVDRADALPGIANLLESTVGETITLTLPTGDVDAVLQPGDLVQCQIRLAGPQRYSMVPGTVRPGRS